MLSIVKMELDSGSDTTDENFTNSKAIDIKKESMGFPNNYGFRDVVRHNLELEPVVYTTKLDDMIVLNSNLTQIGPEEATAKILKESRPLLRGLPTSKCNRRNKKRFNQIKGILKSIYHSPKNINIDEEIDFKPDICTIQIDLNSVKSEVLNTRIFENTEPKTTCTYSELLKLCKPCSVLLPDINKVIHGGQLLQINRVKKPTLSSTSQYSQVPSSDNEDLAHIQPKLFNLLRNSCSSPEKNEYTNDKEKNIVPTIHVSNRPPKLVKSSTVNKTHDNATNLELIPPRVMRNGVLEIHDKFSNDYHIYYTDNESNLLDFFKATPENADVYKNSRIKLDCRYILENCCWVKKDTIIQSLYPKVLIYPNSRFIRNKHPCKPGYCVCCCRKKVNLVKPNLFFAKQQLSSGTALSSHINTTTKTHNTINTTLNEEDIEIQDLEDEIHKSIIKINQTAKLNSTEWLRKLLSEKCSNSKHVPNSLIEKALGYKKLLPKKQVENRRLVTIKQGDSQDTVIILRNFALDVTEIYSINTDGDIESHIKTTCYNNTSQPGIKKLLKRPNSINETVCCWFKREKIITNLCNGKTLHPSAVKFIRSNHNCQSKECTCCCKPEIKKDVALTDIKLPSRTDWSATLNLLQLTRTRTETPDLPIPSNSQKIKLPQLISSMYPASSSQNKNALKIPTPTPAPTAAPATKATQILVTDVVENDELSQEVNSLITSILDRFRDVRLTINEDGKVAAALNTPVSKLSTVELKVLANILSYAQSQVNLLGSKVNSGISLSSIINLKVDDVQSNLDPKSIYKEFGKNINIPTTSLEQVSISRNNIPRVPTAPSVPQTYSNFSNSMSAKNLHFNDAFSSFINSRMSPNPIPETVTPVIENVFSLKNEPDLDSSSTTVWYRKPNTQVNLSEKPTEAPNPNKTEKQIDDLPGLTPKKKIRVMSPSKLGVPTNRPEVITLPAQRHIQPPMALGNVMPQIPLLMNNNTFQVQNLGISQIQSINNMSLGPISQPILIINPLNTPNFINNTGSVYVPLSNSNLSNLNVVNISNSQPNIQIVNTTSVPPLVNMENKNVSVVQSVTNPTPPDVEVIEIPEYDETNKMVNCTDIEPKMEFCVDDTEPEDEDCILGF